MSSSRAHPFEKRTWIKTWLFGWNEIVCRTPCRKLAGQVRRSFLGFIGSDIWLVLWPVPNSFVSWAGCMQENIPTGELNQLRRNVLIIWLILNVSHGCRSLDMMITFFTASLFNHILANHPISQLIWILFCTNMFKQIIKNSMSSCWYVFMPAGKLKLIF